MQIAELVESPDNELQDWTLKALRQAIEQIDNSAVDTYDRSLQRSNLLYWLYNSLLKKVNPYKIYSNGNRYPYPRLKPRGRGMPWSIQPPRRDTPVSQEAMELINSSLRELGYTSQSQFVRCNRRVDQKKKPTDL
jgi:hypothetical protein